MKCEFLSSSGAKTYETCPMRYHARYDLGYRGSSTLAIDAGLLCHKALEYFYNPKNTKSAKECFEIAKQEHPCADMTAYQEAVQMYDDYVAAHPREQYHTIGAEIGFKLFTDSGAAFRGYIDRMDMVDDETIRILDYKTGKYVPTYDELKTAHQTNMYALWTYKHEVFKNIKYVIAEYHYVRTGDEIRIPVHRDKLVEYENYIDYLYHSILNDEKPEPRLNTFCYNCEYKSKCPAYINMIESMLCSTEKNKKKVIDLTIEEMVNKYQQLSSAEKAISNEKKLIGGMLTNELKYSNLSGKIIGDKKVKLTSRKIKKCQKENLVEIVKKYGLEEQVLQAVSLKAVEEAVRGNKEAKNELDEKVYSEASASYPSISKA